LPAAQKRRVDFFGYFSVAEICLPTGLNRKTPVQVFANGKHVVCEKPIALMRDEPEARLVGIEGLQFRRKFHAKAENVCEGETGIFHDRGGDPVFQGDGFSLFKMIFAFLIAFNMSVCNLASNECLRSSPSIKDISSDLRQKIMSGGVKVGDYLPTMDISHNHAPSSPQLTAKARGWLEQPLDGMSFL
jgi:hypothetical protein